MIAGLGLGWIAAVLGASLLGSLHCAGMCGGFVCALAGGRGGGGVPLHTAYHSGRLFGYLALGAAAGGIGSGIERSAWLVGLHGVAPFVCGGVIALFAVIAGARALGLRISLPVPQRPARVIGAVLSRLRDRGPFVRGLALGLGTALLPCGWLYAFVATAAATGSVFGGLTTMSAFWLGTVPVLLGVGIGAGTLWAPIRSRLPLITAGFLLVLGVGTAFGWGPLPPSTRTAATQVIAEGELPEIPTGAPCCDESARDAE